MRNIGFIACCLITALLTAGLPALAGTGTLYSPAGLPQSSNQTYTVPSPQVQGTTVTFPTPPIPLGGALQDFPSSTLPVNGTTSTPQGATANNGQPQGNAVESGSIESFFQCPPPEIPTNKNKSAPIRVIKSPAKLLWHVLDNLGVPMFVGKDNDLDPSLTQTRFIPPAAGNKTRSGDTVAPIPEKIPESELEGTEAFPNDQTQASPK